MNGTPESRVYIDDTTSLTAGKPTSTDEADGDSSRRASRDSESIASLARIDATVK
jgi:hypothetical protein